MKITDKILIFSYLFFIFSLYNSMPIYGMSAEMRAGRLISIADITETLYTKKDLEGEGETRTWVGGPWWLWCNFNVSRYYTGEGLEKIHIKFFPIASGLMAVVPLIPYFVHLYGGVGLSYYLRQLSTVNHEIPMTSRFLNSNWGGVGKSGITVSLTHHLFIDFFADYYYPHVLLTHGNTRILGNHGSVRTGFGVGFHV